MARSPAQRQRRSIRLKGYDYTRAGAYFVTLCTQDRACLFGSVLEGETQLNEFGRKVADCWLWLAERHPYVDLDEWIVMPNHIHGIIAIMDDAHGGDGGRGGSDGGRGGSRTAPTAGLHDIPTGPTGRPIIPAATPQRKPLGRLIGAFKTVSTRHINAMRSTPGAKLWQRNYYEHIIRDALRCIVSANT